MAARSECPVSGCNLLEFLLFCIGYYTRELTRNIYEDQEIGFKTDSYARILQHRSCWLHAIACHYAQQKKTGKKISKLQANELRILEYISPCFLDISPFPCRKRSKSRRKRKYEITRPVAKEKRMDSAQFDNYFEILWRSFPEDKKTSFGYMDSLWFSLYRKESFKEKVLSWIKRKKIFLKKYVLVPIVSWSHWNLLIFCHFGKSFQSENQTPCMLLLDSLGNADPRRVEPDIRKFVLDIFRSEGRDEDKKIIYKMPFLVPKVPQQRNGEECGNFVLYFINLFVQNAPENFNIQGYPYFMKQSWFSMEHLDSFLEGLKSCRDQVVDVLTKLSRVTDQAHGGSPFACGGIMSKVYYQISS